MTLPRASLILIVDDDPGVLRPLALNLGLEGFRTITAHDGKTAIRHVRDRRPALVLLDVMMPAMDGLETCTRIRELSEVPIVMVTAKDSRVDVVGGLDAGADDYITKPFDMDEVVARVRAVLKRNRPPQEASQALFRSGGLFIDFTSGRVAMGNVDVQLPPTEYRILCLLAGNAGRVVTYRELLAEVWKGEYGVDTHVMHVAVARLRKKLGDEPGKGNLISNRSGFGYVLKIHTREHGMVACNSSQPEGTAVVSTSAPHVVDTAWNAPVIPGVSEMPRPPVSIGCPPT